MTTEGEVLGDGHRGHEREVLVHHADPARDRLGGAREPHARRRATMMRAGVGALHAVRDAHQRRLSRAVLAEQGVHGPGTHAQGTPSSSALNGAKRLSMPWSARASGASRDRGRVIGPSEAGRCGDESPRNAERSLDLLRRARAHRMSRWRSARRTAPRSRAPGASTAVWCGPSPTISVSTPRCRSLRAACRSMPRAGADAPNARVRRSGVTPTVTSCPPSRRASCVAALRESLRVASSHVTHHADRRSTESARTRRSGVRPSARASSALLPSVG